MSGGISISHSSYGEQLFSIADLNLPANIKELMVLARYFSLTNEIVMPALHMASQLPITQLSYSGVSDKQARNWKTLLEDKLELRKKLINFSYSTNTLGNAMTSVAFMPHRQFICSNCGKAIMQLSSIRRRKFTGGKISGICPRCNKAATFSVRNTEARKPEDVRIIEWTPTNMEIQDYQLIGEKEYFYHISNKDRYRIMSGDEKYLSTLEDVFIESALKNKAIHIEKKNFYHFYTFMIPGLYDGWGIPRIVSALKIIYHLSIIMRANEAVSLGKLNDFTILYPESSNVVSNPIGALGPNNWVENVRGMLKQYYKNKTYVGISPVPVGYQSIFGNGRAELIVGELELYYRAIATVMGIPYDILFSSAPYTSLVASSRIVTNQLSLARRQINNYLRFIVDRISKYLNSKEYPGRVKVELEDYKTPDTIQELAMLANMATPGPYRKISDSTLLQKFGINYKDEIQQMKEDEENRQEYVKKLKMDEVISQYYADRAAQAYQQMLQRVVRPGDIEGLDEIKDEDEKQERLDSVITTMAKRILAMPMGDRASALNIIYGQSPEIASLVQQKLKSAGADPTEYSQQMEAGAARASATQQGIRAQGQPQQQIENGPITPIPQQQPFLKPPRQ